MIVAGQITIHGNCALVIGAARSVVAFVEFVAVGCVAGAMIGGVGVAFKSADHFEFVGVVGSVFAQAVA